MLEAVDPRVVLAKMMEEKLVIHGRRFLPVERMTFAHRHYILKELEASGCLPHASAPDDPDLMTARVISVAYESGHFFTAMAGLLVVEDTKWTEELARHNAEVFAALEDTELVDRLTVLFLYLIFSFFFSSAALSRIFLKYLVGAKRNSVAISSSEEEPSKSLSGAEAIQILETWQSSSEPSPTPVGSQ